MWWQDDVCMKYSLDAGGNNNSYIEWGNHIFSELNLFELINIFDKICIEIYFLILIIVSLMHPSVIMWLTSHELRTF